MNRLNALIEYWFNAADISRIPMPGCMDRELHAKAVKENHAFCDVADAIRRGYRR